VNKETWPYKKCVQIVAGKGSLFDNSLKFRSQIVSLKMEEANELIVLAELLSQ
jgi:hypothetical protein